MDVLPDGIRANHEGDSGTHLLPDDNDIYSGFFVLVRARGALRGDGFDAVRGCAFFGFGALLRFLAGGTVSVLTTVRVISSCVCLIGFISFSVALRVQPLDLTNDLK